MKKAGFAPVVMNWMTNRGGLATFISKTWLIFTGRSIDEELGRGWQENIHPDDLKDCLALISSSPAECEEITLEFRVRHSSGVYRRVVNSVYPYFSSDGQFSGWAGSGLVMDTEPGFAKDDHLYQLMSESMNELICLISHDARIQYISPSVKKMLGYSPEELTGKPLFNFFFTENDKSEFDLFFNNVQVSDGPHYYEIRLPSKSGEFVWLEIDTKFMRDQEGQLLSLQTVSRDITTRKQHEEMLYLANEVGAILWEDSDLTTSLDRVLQTVMKIEGLDCGGVYMVDPATQNLNLITYTGLSPEFAAAVRHIPAGHPTSQLSKSSQPVYSSYPELVAKLPDGMEDQRAAEKLLGFAAIPIIYNQELIAVFNLASHTHIEIPKNSRRTVEFLARQIGAMIARNRTETALRESQGNLSTLFNNLDDFIIILDEEGYILKTNTVVERRLGYSWYDLRGMHYLDLHPLSNNKETNDLMKSILTGKAYLRHYPLVGSDGSEILVETRVSRGIWNGKKALFCISRDVTTRIMAETALRESEEKFRSFFEQTADTFSLVDENGYIIEWNHASELMTGLLQKDTVGKFGVDVQFQLLPPERKSEKVYQKMRERYASIHQSGEASFFNHILEGEIVDACGNLRSFQQLIFPIQTSKGFMIGSSGRDVTLQKKIEQAEREQRKLTEALMVSSSVLNSSLKLEDVFEAIFEHLNKIVPHESGSLMLINRLNGKARVCGAIGFQQKSYALIENSREFPFRELPILAKMFENMKPEIINNTRSSPDWIGYHQNSDMHSYLGAPICIQKEVIGFLNLGSSKAGYFEPRHADWLKAFANQAAMAIENARLFSQVEQLAVLDELTNVYNRRGMKEIGDREVERAIRFEHPLSALFLDIDHFKEINDHHSHAVGDHILQSVASISSSMLRSVDVIARYGGEEFVFLLPETELQGAVQTAERLRQEIEKATVSTDAGNLGVTVSIGVACLRDETKSLETLLEKADQAVHTAKAGGRNRVVVEN
jgi:diguanylate cyclase (GGDEF)-like protein/PAS domain S-box-containing protein